VAEFVEKVVENVKKVENMVENVKKVVEKWKKWKIAKILVMIPLTRSALFLRIPPYPHPKSDILCLFVNVDTIPGFTNSRVVPPHHDSLTPWLHPGFGRLQDAVRIDMIACPKTRVTIINIRPVSHLNPNPETYTLNALRSHPIHIPE